MTPYKRNLRLRKDRSIAAILMACDFAVPVDVEARLIEQGITLKRIRSEYDIDNL